MFEKNLNIKRDFDVELHEHIKDVKCMPTAMSHDKFRSWLFSQLETRKCGGPRSFWRRGTTATTFSTNTRSSRGQPRPPGHLLQKTRSFFSTKVPGVFE